MDEEQLKTLKLVVSEEKAQSKAVEPEFIPGQLIQDKYLVRSVIGRSGMGVVYEVENVLVQKRYALKTLEKENYSESTFRRFQQEAKATALLDHMYLIRVHDVGLLPDQRPYLVMDYVDGDTLAQRIKKGPLPVKEALPLFIQVSFGAWTSRRTS